MKPSDLKLPVETQARIQVLETIRQLCRGSLPHTSARLVGAYASEIEIIDSRLAEMRKSASTALRDKPEAALAGGR